MTVWLSIAVLLAPTASGAIVLEGSPLDEPMRLPANGVAPMPRGPISIDGDDDWCRPLSGVTNCLEADGSCEKPYRINGWTIELSSDGASPALSIQNTRKCAVVTGNFFLAAPGTSVPAVYFRNVSNVDFVTNTVNAGRAPGIDAAEFFKGSIGRIHDNTITAVLSDGATIRLVRVADSPDLVFTGNALGAEEQARDNVDAYLRVARSPRATIQGNVYDAASATAVSLEDSEDARVKGERIVGVRDGVSLLRSARATLSGNDYEDLTGTAITVTSSPSVSITDEDMTTVMQAASISKSPGVTVQDLQATQLASGIFVVDSTSLTLSASSLEDYHPCRPSCLETFGMLAQGTSLSMSTTTVSGFDTGIHFDSVSPHAFHGECLNITKNQVGVLVTNMGSGNITKSIIDGNLDTGIENTLQSTFQAKRNWWGDATGPSGGDRVVGKVQWEPDLDAAPECAPQ